MSSALKNMASLVLIPFNLSALWALGVFFPVFSLKSRETVFFLSGLAVYSILYLKFPQRFSGLYILAHELSHALWGLVRGNRIKKISVGKNSGYVLFSKKTDFWTAMAPYIFPFYAFAAAAVFFTVSLFQDLHAWRNWFLGLEGFFLGFHFFNTASVMTSSIQSDFKKTRAPFFSYLAVFSLNILFLALILKLLFPQKAGLGIFFSALYSNFKMLISAFFSLLTRITLIIWRAA
ncbi:MAG: hypothetical protein Fur0012_10110 [Elusimicrobiota bacterium]